MAWNGRLKVPVLLAASAVAVACGDDGRGDTGQQPTTETSATTGEIVVVCGTHTDMGSCEGDPDCQWLEVSASSGSDTGSSTTGADVPGYCDVDCAAFGTQAQCDMLDQCVWDGSSCLYAAI